MHATLSQQRIAAGRHGEKNALAAAFFLTLDARNRYSVLWRVQTAKRIETRQKRIAELVAMLARGEKVHP